MLQPLLPNQTKTCPTCGDLVTQVDDHEWLCSNCGTLGDDEHEAPDDYELPEEFYD